MVRQDAITLHIFKQILYIVIELKKCFCNTCICIYPLCQIIKTPQHLFLVSIGGAAVSMGGAAVQQTDQQPSQTITSAYDGTCTAGMFSTGNGDYSKLLLYYVLSYFIMSKLHKVTLVLSIMAAIFHPVAAEWLF